MDDGAWNPATVFELFGDELARRILVLASDQQVAADDLTDQLDASQPTVYRRINSLLEYDLLKERQQVDTDGNHYKTYETTLKRVAFEIDDGGYDIEIRLRRSLVDQFEAFWSDLEQSRRADDGGTERSGPAHPGEDTHHG